MSVPCECFMLCRYRSQKGYQPRCNIVKDEKGDLVANPHSIVVRWRNYFS